MQNYVIDDKGYYGEFGGAYIPEILHKCVKELEEAYRDIIIARSFKATSISCCETTWARRRSTIRDSSDRYGCKVYLKRRI